MTLEPESDLHWRAFLYIAGELSAEEAADFERVLLEDQPAREAVASAMALVELVGRAGESPNPQTLPIRRSRRRALAWVAAVAAGLIGLAAIRSLYTINPIESNASVVALSWSGLRQGIDSDWNDIVAGPHPAGLTEAGDTEEAIEPSSERPLPSWLITAASNRKAESSPEEN